MRVRTLRSGSISLDELEDLYRREGAAFERVAVAILGDAELGCDAVHDAFVLAVLNRDRYRGEAPLVAWMWRIVINEARKRRARGASTVATNLGELEAGAASTNGTADRARVRASIAALPDRQRLTLFLRYYADLDYAAIAETLDVQPGTVAATLSAARARLAAELQEVHEWEL
jgi:RNA polymerase sigma factor (sigma-70 family)